MYIVLDYALIFLLNDLYSVLQKEYINYLTCIVYYKILHNKKSDYLKIYHCIHYSPWSIKIMKLPSMIYNYNNIIHNSINTNSFLNASNIFLELIKSPNWIHCIFIIEFFWVFLIFFINISVHIILYILWLILWVVKLTTI
jgi:hypothetical protein